MENFVFLPRFPPFFRAVCEETAKGGWDCYWSCCAWVPPHLIFTIRIQRQRNQFKDGHTCFHTTTSWAKSIGFRRRPFFLDAWFASKHVKGVSHGESDLDSHLGFFKNGRPIIAGKSLNSGDRLTSVLTTEQHPTSLPPERKKTDKGCTRKFVFLIKNWSWIPRGAGLGVKVCERHVKDVISEKNRT